MKKFIHLPSKKNLEGIQMTKEFLSAHRYLAELKGIVLILPNENILLSNLALQEAKGSSAIENIITSQDSLYKHQVVPENKNKSDKEVHSYAKALKEGRQKVKKEGIVLYEFFSSMGCAKDCFKIVT